MTLENLVEKLENLVAKQALIPFALGSELEPLGLHTGTSPTIIRSHIEFEIQQPYTSRLNLAARLLGGNVGIQRLLNTLKKS